MGRSKFKPIFASKEQRAINIVKSITSDDDLKRASKEIRALYPDSEYPKIGCIVNAEDDLRLYILIRSKEHQDRLNQRVRDAWRNWAKTNSKQQSS